MGRGYRRILHHLMPIQWAGLINTEQLGLPDLKWSGGNPPARQ